MKPYKHLFFDLDQTLWDHDCNANETLEDLYREFQLHEYRSFTLEGFKDMFHKVNHRLWHDYHLGKVDKVFIRQERFGMVLKILGVPDFKYCQELAVQYLEICPRKGNLMPHTMEVLEYLKQKYPMSIITNGFHEVQDIKLTSSGIDKFFEMVVTSEKAGWLKPHVGIFNFAMDGAKVNATECVMIGDNPVTDIGGAMNSGIDQVYYNSRKIEHSPEPTFIIDSLIQLKKIL